jgi:Cu+-exporting ATPase
MPAHTHDHPHAGASTDAHEHGHAHGHGHDCCASAESAALKDPVCGMTVTAQSPHRFELDGQPFYFCSAGCRAKFAADPEAYLEASKPPAPPPAAPSC